jgi:hypothetical protein
MAAIHDFYASLPPAHQHEMVAALESNGRAQSFYKGLAREDQKTFAAQRRAAYAHPAVRARGSIHAHPALDPLRPPAR